MSLTTRNIPQLFNGVSRQPAILRSIDQTESELNSWAALSSGVGKRPPTENVVKLANSIGPTAFLHTINRDTAERYQVIIEGATVKVVDFDGVEHTVNAPGGTAYLSGGDLAAVTVADYTFIINRNVAVEMKAVGSDLSAPPPYLRDLRRAPRWNGAEVDLAGSETQYEPNAAQDAAVTGRVASIEKLPETAPNGAVYEVLGSTASPFASFYVVRNGTVWDETVKPGLTNAVDETTMPHCLIREGDGTFTFAPFSWAPRRVGDETTNPLPTFVGRKLKDVFFYQNRLAFLVDENIILSAAGDFGNFWRNTVLDVIASDVVDVAVTTAQVSILEHAVLFNDGALLIADQTQFSLSNGEDGVTPSSLAIRPVTHYVVNKDAEPVQIGSEVYFAGEAAGKTSIYEYSRLQDTDSTLAADITAHVPGLLPGGLKFLTTGPRSLFAFPGDTTAYAYQLYWNGQEKLMSAWRPWQFRGNVRAASSVDDHLYLVVEYADGVFLEKLDLSEGAKPDSQPKQVFLDRRVEVVGTYDAVNDWTTFNLPYTVAAADRGLVDVVMGTGSTHPHLRANPGTISWVDSDTLRVDGQVSGTASIGFRYEFHLELSEQFPVDPQGRPLTSGRLQLRTFTVRYTDSGYFDVEVYPYGKAPSVALEDNYPKRIVTFTGKVLASANLVLGEPSYEDGSFRVPVAGHSRRAVIRIVNHSYMASTFSSAEWEGLFNSRAMG